ncbi:UNVERIFIED_ORG: transcriptional regulator of acetoin/glycerol metabolism [Gordonia westfalica J30]
MSVVLNTADDGMEVRSVIERSWKRSSICGVAREKQLQLPYHDEFDDDSRLFRAAKPVIERLADTMTDTRHSLLLADPHARIIHRWVGSSSLYGPLDNASIAPGFEFDEEYAGTNGVGTAREEERVVTVLGDEHFAEPLRHFSCVGVPIRNPIRGQVEGILDFSCLARDFNPLMTPLLVEVAKHIETRFAQQSSAAESALLESFVRASRGYRGPVVGMRPNMFLTNTAAAEQIGTADQALLWDTVATQSRSGRSEGVVELSGGRFLFRLMPVDEQLGGVVIRLCPEVSVKSVRASEAARREPSRAARSKRLDDRPALALSGRSPQWKKLITRLGDLTDIAEPVVFTGAAGSGKLWLARRLAAQRGGGVQVFDSALERVSGQESLVDRCRSALDDGSVVLVRRIDELSVQVRNELGTLMRSSRAPMGLVATCIDDPRDSVVRVLAGFTHQVWVPPLAQRLDDMVDIVPTLLAELAPDRAISCTLSAQQVLMRYSWPGNVAELRDVLAATLTDLPGGQIEVMHLPAWLRKRATRRQLTPYEQSERDLIIDTLASVGNNRAEAARVLGIGRATLYRKLRTLSISNGNELTD